MTTLLFLFSMVFASVVFVNSASAQATSAPLVAQLNNPTGACKDSMFFGLPTWYKYLPREPKPPCEVKINEIKDFTLILLAVVEILIRVSALIALGYIIWGGIKYTTSQGSPEGTKAAKDTIANALIGFIITVTATALITLLAQRLG